MKKLFVIIVLGLLLSASAPVIPEPGEGWQDVCRGNVILSESIYWGEVWVRCDNSALSLLSRLKSWERGCYGAVVAFAHPSLRYIICEEVGIP